MADIEKISVREFRNNMAKYTETESPFAVMKHGHTIGYYIPVHTKPKEADYNALRMASVAFDKMMQDNGLHEDNLLEDFKVLRKG